MTQPSADAARAIVESFAADSVTGWVEAPVGVPAPTVELYVDDLRVDSVFAAGAADRHATGEVRGFRFLLADLWRFVGPSNRITVRIGGRPVPIAGHGMFRVPESAGERSVGELRERLAAGEVFSRTGALQLSKSLDAEWQHAVLELYGRLRGELPDHQPFLAYGTLLGAIREGGFIGHDLDFDSAFVSRRHDAAAAARDLQQVAFTAPRSGGRCASGTGSPRCSSRRETASRRTKARTRSCTG